MKHQVRSASQSAHVDIRKILERLQIAASSELAFVGAAPRRSFLGRHQDDLARVYFHVYIHDHISYLYIYYTILYYITLHYIILHYIILYYMISYYIMLYYITLHYNILYHIIPYHMILHIILCYVMLYYVI